MKTERKTYRLYMGLAVFVFIFTAINFYAFLYMSRECLRHLSINDYNDLWVLSAEETNFYNYFYAAIAIIMAMGSASRFLVDRPSFLDGSIRKRTTTLNDSRVLNWVFIMWMTKLGTLFGLFL